MKARVVTLTLSTPAPGVTARSITLAPQALDGNGVAVANPLAVALDATAVTVNLPIGQTVAGTITDSDGSRTAVGHFSVTVTPEPLAVGPVAVTQGDLLDLPDPPPVVVEPAATTEQAPPAA